MNKSKDVAVRKASEDVCARVTSADVPVINAWLDVCQGLHLQMCL
jgi:hypothetical protein